MKSQACATERIISFTTWKSRALRLPVTVKNLEVKMSKVEEGLAAKESDEWFFEYLNERFTKDVFLSGDSMREQLNLIGIVFGEAMHKAFHKENVNISDKYGYKLVGQLFARRNKIAHQNDRDHSSAAQTDITSQSLTMQK